MIPFHLFFLKRPILNFNLEEYRGPGTLKFNHEEYCGPRTLNLNLAVYRGSGTLNFNHEEYYGPGALNLNLAEHWCSKVTFIQKQPRFTDLYHDQVCMFYN